MTKCKCILPSLRHIHKINFTWSFLKMRLMQILQWRREREVNPTSTQKSFQKHSYMTWTLVNIKNIDILIMFIPVRDPGGLDIWHCRVSLAVRGSSLGNACVYLTTVENLWRVRRCKQGCDFSNTPTRMLTLCAHTHRQKKDIDLALISLLTSQHMK